MIKQTEHKPPKKYLYVYVEYEDMIENKLYCYQTKDTSIKKGDKVLVDKDGKKVFAKVITTKYYTWLQLPYPLQQTKEIISKINEAFDTYCETQRPNIILNYSLNDAWFNPIWGIIIVDRPQNNVFIKEKNNCFQYISI